MNFRDEEGATLVEFGICSSVLFMTVFGILGLSFALYSYNFVAEAARDASRYAMVRGSSCIGFSDCNINSAKLQTYVQNLSYPGINPVNLTVTASWPSGNAPGDTVSVTVGYQFPLNIPFWPKTGSILQMASTSEMTISQ
jgi:Flp pilus assembly protein TadG